MTKKIRTVRSGIVGLDLALGGGFRFVRRTYLGEQESATLLVRGGPGTGKSVVAEDLALRLAAAVDGDVVYLCVEVLPAEVLAQRMGFDDFDAARVVDLADPKVRSIDHEKPTLVLGMRDAPPDEDGVPDIGGALLDLARIATARGYRPKVMVVDSLSEGYQLGSSVPRATVDGVCKLAVEQGWVLILVEETGTDGVSPWAFAVDTVLSLRVAQMPTPQQARRELMVTKHRFGGCEPGPHRLLIERERVRVIPPFAAYRNAVRDLELPPPATGRSLAIPVMGLTPLEQLGVEDGQGRCVVVEGSALDAELARITGNIGDLDSSGAPHLGARMTFLLAERRRTSVIMDEKGLCRGTLHQFIDGEEWIEDALCQIEQFCQTFGTAISRVRVGPTERLEKYENSGDLARAVSLFVDLMSAHGYVVVIYGVNARSLIRSGIVSDCWTISQAPPPPRSTTPSPLVVDVVTYGHTDGERRARFTLSPPSTT